MEEANSRIRTGGVGSAGKGWLGGGKGWEFPWGDLVFQVVPSVSGQPAWSPQTSYTDVYVSMFLNSETL